MRSISLVVATSLAAVPGLVMLLGVSLLQGVAVGAAVVGSVVLMAAPTLGLARFFHPSKRIEGLAGLTFLWSLTLFLGLPGYVPGDRSEAVEAALAVPLASIGLGQVGDRVTDIVAVLPDEDNAPQGWVDVPAPLGAAAVPGANLGPRAAPVAPGPKGLPASEAIRLLSEDPAEVERALRPAPVQKRRPHPQSGSILVQRALVAER